MRLPVKRREIAETIRGRIRAGIYSAGERIPTEPQLARSLGVARETLRGALSLLHNEGLIQRISGEGTFVAGNPGRKRETRDLFLLIPCSDYFVKSDYQTRTALSEILTGCLNESNYRSAHIVTLPITFDNDLENIDWGALERLPDGCRVVFYNNWCPSIYGLLKKKNCRVVNIHYLAYENQPANAFLSQWASCCADTRGAVCDSVRVLRRSGCRNIAIAEAFLDDAYNPAKRGYLDGIALHNPGQEPVMRDIGGYQEPSMRFRSLLGGLYREQPFDGLIFGVHDDLRIDYRHSLNWNLGLPEEVKIITVFPYEYNRNLTPHVPCYMFDYREMARMAVRFLFSEEYDPAKYVFKHRFQYLEQENPLYGTGQPSPSFLLNLKSGKDRP